MDKMKKPTDSEKKWSFLDTSRRLIEENRQASKNKQALPDDPKGSVANSDNLAELEPEMTPLVFSKRN